VVHRWEDEEAMTDYETLMRESTVAQPTPTPQVDNPYLEMMQGYKSATATAAQGANVVNADANPDTAARAQELSQTLRVPSAIIEADLPTYEARAKAIKDNAVVSSSPVLANWIANNREASRAAQDDFDKLGFVEKTLTALKSGGSAALNQNQLGRLYNVKQVGDTFGVKTPETDKEIHSLEASMSKPLPAAHGGYGFLQETAAFATGALDNIISSLPEIAGGAGLGAAVSGPGAPLGALAGGTTGFGIGVKVDMARIAAGLNYRSTQYVLDSDGKPMSQTARNVGALLTGALTYGVASFKLKAGGEVANSTMSHFTSEAVTEALKRPTVSAAISNVTKATAKGAAIGAAINGSMEASTIIGEEVAKQLSLGDFHTLLNDPATRDEAFSRLTDAAENGALMFGAMFGVGSGLGLAGDLMRARQAHIDVQTLKTLHEGAANSNLRERSPSTFLDFMRHQTDGSPVENLYLPVEKVLKLYQDSKINPEVSTC
jgi:hypothetical protein